MSTISRIVMQAWPDKTGLQMGTAFMDGKGEHPVQIAWPCNSLNLQTAQPGNEQLEGESWHNSSLGKQQTRFHLRAALRRACCGSLGPLFSLWRRLRLSMIQSANVFWLLLSSKPPSSCQSYEASDSGSEKSSGSESDSCCFRRFLTGPGTINRSQICGSTAVRWLRVAVGLVLFAPIVVRSADSLQLCEAHIMTRACSSARCMRPEEIDAG